MASMEVMDWTCPICGNSYSIFGMQKLQHTKGKQPTVFALNGIFKNQKIFQFVQRKPKKRKKLDGEMQLRPKTPHTAAIKNLILVRFVRKLCI